MIQESSADKRQSLYLYTDQYSYEPLARIDRNGNQEQHIYYFHTDLNGMPEELTDEAGEIVWECSYQLWGKPVQEIAHTEIQQNLRYQGQYLDRETGLHYNTFRYYNLDTGRFTQPNPIGLNGGINLYAYGPNPLTWIDPLGLTKDPVYENSGHHDPHHLKNRRFQLNKTKSVIPKMPRNFLNIVRLILMIQQLDGQKLVKGKRLFGIDSKVLRQIVLVLFIGMVLQIASILKANRMQLLCKMFLNLPRK